MLCATLFFAIFPLFAFESPVDFDYYVLSMNHPEAICRANNGMHARTCRIPNGANTWTIHGLWPSSNAKTGVAFCTTESFHKNELKPIWEKLVTVWPTLIAGRKHESFWEHEFEKHGTCAAPQLQNAIDYFNKAIALLEKFDIHRMLQAGGVKPSEDVRYTMADLQRAVGAPKMQFRCVHDKDSDWLLAEVRTCLDKAFNAINCRPQGKHDKKNYEKLLAREGPLPPIISCPEKGIKYIQAVQQKRPSSGVTKSSTEANLPSSTIAVTASVPVRSTTLSSAEDVTSVAVISMTSPSSKEETATEENATGKPPAVKLEVIVHARYTVVSASSSVQAFSFVGFAALVLLYDHSFT